MLLAVLFAVVFSSVMLAAVTPVHDGVGIVAFTQGASPAQTAGMQAYTVITSVNNTEIHSYADFRNEMSKTVAGQNLTVVAFDPTTSATASTTGSKPCSLAYGRASPPPSGTGSSAGCPCHLRS